MPRLGFVLLVVIAALAVPAGASASITIGPANPNPEPLASQAAPWLNGSLLFTTSGPAGAIMATPAEGVITSWRLYTDDVLGEATAQLYALAPTEGGKYRVSAAGPKQPMPAAKAEGASDHNLLHSFQTRVPVPTGVMLGVRFEQMGSLYAIPVVTVGSGLATGYFGGGGPAVPVDGGVAEPFPYLGGALAMNATLEPDADHDGYGDETQDACVGVCQPPAPTPKKHAKPKKCKKGKVRKHGKCVKKKTHRKKAHHR